MADRRIKLRNRPGPAPRGQRGLRPDPQLGLTGIHRILQYSGFPPLRRDAKWFLHLLCKTLPPQVQRRKRRSHPGVSDSYLGWTPGRNFLQFPGWAPPTVQTVCKPHLVLKATPMKICLVATFPPSGRQLNEYAYHIAQELQRNPSVRLTILADELTAYDFATDGKGNPLDGQQQQELPGFSVIRCWKFGSMATPMCLLKTVRKLKPDVVWFNLVFSSFATPEKPFAAFLGLSAPALLRASGFYTHVTLHHITEHVDFAGAGVQRSREKLFRIGSEMVTRMLLKAHSVSVLLPGYHRTLITKYSVRNVLLSTHGTFARTPTSPD